MKERPRQSISGAMEFLVGIFPNKLSSALDLCKSFLQKIGVFTYNYRQSAASLSELATKTLSKRTGEVSGTRSDGV
jgi:hypothetical protein